MDCEQTTKVIVQEALKLVDPKCAGLCIEAGAGTDNFYAQYFRTWGYSAWMIEPLPMDRASAVCAEHNIQLIQVALGSQEGEGALYLGRDANYASLRQDWFARTHGEQMVQVRTLCKLLEQQDVRHLSCLKLDIEGSEPDVIATLPNLPPELLPSVLAFEYGGMPNRAAATGVWSDEYRARTLQSIYTLRDLGYKQAFILDAALDYIVVMDMANLPTDRALLDETLFDMRCVYGMIVVLRGASALSTETVGKLTGLDVLRGSRCGWEYTDAESRPDISVVSGTYNRLPLLQEMVASARREALADLKVEFVLVDGGSTDGTQAWIATQSDIRLIQHTRLHGAILAFNDGAYAARGRYVVLANDDIVFQPGSIAAAFAALEDTPGIGAIAFEEKRTNTDWRVSTYHTARDPNVHVIMPQVCMVPRELGDRAQWWKLPGALTYGGDFALGCRLAEMGFRVAKTPQARIFDKQYSDNLRRINMRSGEKAISWHPDGDMFLKWRPHGVHVADAPLFPFAPPSPKLRVMHLPIRAPIQADPNAYLNQQTQMRGMNEALARIGRLLVYDYLHEAERRGVSGMRQHLLDTIAAFVPHLILFQLHGPMGGIDAEFVQALRQVVPTAYFVNWIGDVYPDMMLSPSALSLARVMDMTGVVNAEVLRNYVAHGLRAAYWQIGYEPDMLTADPDDAMPHHDVVFLGSGNNAHREKLGRVLRGLRNVNVGLYGIWSAEYTPDGVCYQDFKRQGQLYRAAKLAIADQEWPELDGFCSNRTFNLLVAGGALCLHRRFKGMQERLGLIDGVHFIGWDDIEELPGLIEFWLDPLREDARRKIAKAAQAHILEKHSFDERVRQLIFEMLPNLESEHG